MSRLTQPTDIVPIDDVQASLMHRCIMHLTLFPSSAVTNTCLLLIMKVRLTQVLIFTWRMGPYLRAIYEAEFRHWQLYRS